MRATIRQRCVYRSSVTGRPSPPQNASTPEIPLCCVTLYRSPRKARFRAPRDSPLTPAAPLYSGQVTKLERRGGRSGEEEAAR